MRAGAIRGDARWRWGLFAAFLVLTALRLPRVFFGGRFWAEEALVFYWHAATLPWRAALFYSYAGYMNLGANLGGVLAYYLVPLDFAPRVTEALSFLVQICPALLLVTARADWLRSRWALGASLFLLVAAPAGEEVWLNTLHSQFYLAAGVGLILALEIEPGWCEVFKSLILFLAPLFGPVAIILLPLFALRAVLEKDLLRARQFLFLGAGAAIQLGLFYTPYRRPVLDLPLLLGMIYAKNILAPFLGYHGSAPFLRVLLRSLKYDMLPGFVIAGLAAASALAAYLLYKAPKAAWWLGAAGLTAAVFSYYGALLPSPDEVGAHSGERYALVPQVLLAWGLVAVAACGEARRRKVAKVLAVWMCLGSGYAYLTPGYMFDHGVAWQREMVKWHKNPDYEPVVWPGHGHWYLPMPLPARRPD